jgi:putative transcriptional regulator
MAKVTDQVGERLVQLRQERGVSQSELARVSGVNPSTISRIERGEIPSPGTETIRKLAYALSVSGSDLMPDVAPNDAARLLPRTVQAIPRDAPALLMELVDRQVEGIVRLIFEGATHQNQLPPHHEKDGPVNDNGASSGDGYFKMKPRTYGAPFLPPVRAGALALV